jgi:hypothetical protein
MFRRIELIYGRGDSADFKHGLCGGSFLEIAESWVPYLQCPKCKGLGKNCRFFFTETGWKEIGKNTVKTCLRQNQRFRIIKVKEKSVDIVYKDRHQVAVRPR